MIVVKGQLYTKVETTIQKSTKSNQSRMDLSVKSLNTINFFLSRIVPDLTTKTLPVEFIDKIKSDSYL